MHNFSEKPQNIFQTKGPVGNGPRRNATLIRARVLELVICAGSTESLIGNGIPGGKLDKKWQINFSPAYLLMPIQKLCLKRPVPDHFWTDFSIHNLVLRTRKKVDRDEEK